MKLVRCKRNLSISEGTINSEYRVINYLLKYCDSNGKNRIIPMPKEIVALHPSFMRRKESRDK
jgi:hypothetical protein